MILVLAGALACIDFGLVRDGAGPSSGRDPEVEDTADQERTWLRWPSAPGNPPVGSSATEECDGLDNDGDGQVDEGFDDVDNDGIADCVDESCWVDEVEAETVAWAAECPSSLVPAADPWDVVVVADYIPDEVSIGTHRVFGDLDGDALPEHAVIGVDGNWSGVLWVQSIAVGGEPFTIGPFTNDSDVALGRLGAGVAGAIGYGDDCEVRAVTVAGSLLWESDPVCELGWFMSNSLRLADLRGLGATDVLTHRAIVSGLDGAVVAELEGSERPRYAQGYEITVADLDLDGFPEILSNWRLYRHDGALVTEVFAHYDAYGCVPIPVQADSDLEGEVLWFSWPEMVLTDHDGLEIDRFTTAGDSAAASLACAADLDEDGGTEVIYTTREEIHALHMDGSTLWQQPIDDPTAWIGCTVVDLDLDGVPEVLYIEHSGFHILDGRTGTEVFGDPSFESLTGGDVPYVLDIDGDGSTEIVASAGSQQTSTPVRIYGHASGGWPPARDVWAWANWSGLGLDESLAPTWPLPPTWLESHIYRGQPAEPVAVYDLAPEVVDACVASCEGGEVRLSVRVVNGGPKALPAATPLAVYLLDAAGERSLWTTLLADSWVPAGTAGASQELVFTLDELQHGVVLVAGDDGSGAMPEPECDPASNEVIWRPEACG